MDEIEARDRSSQRANLIEQRMFEITLTSMDTLKHSTAIEIRKAQNEMKKRLRRYRDRQREIVKSKPDSNKDPLEELMKRRMKHDAKIRKSQNRPKTSPAKLQDVNARINRTDTDSESEVEVDATFMVDHQKSKIDLRPKTSMDMYRKGTSLEKYMNRGRLGSDIAQVRYFDEDELKDRGNFYMHQVERRINDEQNNVHSLDDKVAEFCGIDTIQIMSKKRQAKSSFFAARTPDWLNKQKTVLKTNLSTISLKTQRPSTSMGLQQTDTVNSFGNVSASIATPNEV